MAGACQAPPVWREVRTDEGFGRLWEEFEDVAVSQGFPADGEHTDRGLRVYRSKWRTIEAAFGNAERTRLHAEFELEEVTDEQAEDSRKAAEERGEMGLEPLYPVLEAGSERWLMRFRVERQEIHTIGKGLNPVEDDWSGAGNDDPKELRILGMLRLRLGQPLGLDPSYRQEDPRLQYRR